MFGSFGSEVCPPYAKTLLDDQRFIAFMISSELSSVVVLKFRRLYDRLGYDKKNAMCSLILQRCLAFFSWFFIMGHFESWDIIGPYFIFDLSLQKCETLAVTNLPFIHRKLSTWISMAFIVGNQKVFNHWVPGCDSTADFSTQDFSTGWFGCQAKVLPTSPILRCTPFARCSLKLIFFTSSWNWKPENACVDLFVFG